MHLLILCLLLEWLLPVQEAALRRFELRGRAQGTTYLVIYYAADSVFTKSSCDSILRSLDSSMSIYQPYSSINALNAAAKTYTADHHLLQVIKKGKAISRTTRGAFDMTILPLVQAWGFGAKQHTSPPDSAQVTQLMTCTGWRNIRLRGNTIIKKKPCLQLDVNGIAQGYSADVLACYLEQKGIVNYLAEIGGEMRVRGHRQPSGEPLTIGIESPEAETSFGAPLQQQIKVPCGGVTTSGNYRRYYLSGDRAISHLLDPRTGYPLHNELISVTVWAPDAITADAVDNALMVMGLEKGLRFAQQQKNLEAYFIYKKTDGTVGDTATTGFYRMMK